MLDSNLNVLVLMQDVATRRLGMLCSVALLLLVLGAVTIEAYSHSPPSQFEQFLSQVLISKSVHGNIHSLLRLPKLLNIQPLQIVRGREISVHGVGCQRRGLHYGIRAW